MEYAWAKENVPITVSIMAMLNEEQLSVVEKYANDFASAAEGQSLYVAMAIIRNIMATLLLAELISKGEEGFIRTAGILVSLMGESAISVTKGMEAGQEAIKFHRELKDIVRDISGNGHSG